MDDRGWLFGLAAAVLVVAGGLWLGGRDQRRIDQLRPGQATEADVRASLGEPDAVHDDGDGGRALEFTRQPMGHTTLMARIGRDGRLRVIDQVLQPAFFERVRPGMSAAEVRALLGTPMKQWVFERKGEAVWDWRWLRGQERRAFSVRFTLEDGRPAHVIDSADGIDPQELDRGGAG
jgi:hypothetical protein